MRAFVMSLIVVALVSTGVVPVAAEAAESLDLAVSSVQPLGRAAAAELVSESASFGEGIVIRRSGGLDSVAELSVDVLELAGRFTPDGKAALSVRVFDDVDAELSPTLVDDLSSSTASLAGNVKLSDGRQGWFGAAVVEGTITLKIILDGGTANNGDSHIRIHAVGGDGNLIVAELDPASADDRQPEWREEQAQFRADRAQLRASEPPTNNDRAPAAAFTSTGGPGSPKIDLLVAYDSQAIAEIADRNSVSWGAARHQFMALSMTETAMLNLAMLNSQVPARIKVIGYYQANTNWPGPTINGALAPLEDVSDGVLDDVSNERDRLGADLVIFISDDMGAAEASGYQPGPLASAEAYVVMDAGCFFECELTYAHELGHNFGNGHDLTFTNPPGGFSSYSRGKVSVSANKGTINAGWSEEQCPDCVRIMYFSNPSVSFGGWTTGSAIEDNARTMRDQMYTVASYRTAQTTFVGISSFTTNTLKIWTVSGFGDVIAHGGAPFHGDPSDGPILGSVVDIEDNDPWGGYWIVTDQGQIKRYGAAFYGDSSNLNLTQPIVAMTNSTNSGYWMVSKDGGIFAYGSAGFYGSLPGLGISVTNIVDIVARPQGNGYWLLGSDGGVFSFGSAGFYGSLPGLGLSVGDAVSIETNKAGTGYWIVRSNGSVYSFGSAPYRGGLSSTNIVEIDRYSNGNNYRLLRSDGSIARCSGSCIWL